MQIAPEHLTYALVSQEGGLIGSLFTKMGCDTDAFLGELEKILARIPGVTGSGREPDKIYVSPECDRILDLADKIAAQMKDDYISVEHLMLAVFERPTDKLKELFRTFGLEKDAFMQALAGVRNSRVTSDDPEQTYEALVAGCSGHGALASLALCAALLKAFARGRSDQGSTQAER